MARRTLEEIKRTRSESLRNGTYNNRSTQENTVSAGEKNSVEAARQRRRASYQEAKRQYEQSRGTGTVAGNAEITPTTPKQSMQYKAIRNAALRRAEETRKKQNTVGNLYSPAMDDEEETAVSKMSWDEVYPNYKAYLDNLRNTSGYVENKNYVPGSALTYGYDITKSVQNVKGMLKAKDKEEWVSKQEETAVFSVEDNGEGIEESVLPVIFDGNLVARGESSDNKRNMGIGLSVCKSIIKAHRGNMRAENREEGGARMIFTLPMEMEEQHGDQR